MSDTDKKLDDLLGMVHEIRPVVLRIEDGQKAFDTRLRSVEIVGAEHGVKIERIQSDIDGLGRKVRSYQPLSQAEKRGEPRGGWWFSVMEFFEVMPLYAKFIIPWVTTAIAIVIAAWRHR